MPKAEDVKRVIPDTGEPYIEAKAQIKKIMTPTSAHDAVTKEYTDAVGVAAAASITDNFDTLLDDSDVLRVVDGEVDAQSAKITNVATLQTEQNAAINGTTLSNRFPTLLDNNEALRVLDEEINAYSARIKNLANAEMTNQGDAINVETLTEQFPNLLDDNDALRVINAEIDASSARVKNLANATLTNNNDAVNVESVKLIFADSAPSVDLITLTELTDSELAIESVNARMVALGEAVNRLEQAIAAQSIIEVPS